uniref:Uncharacterized protein n=1 Tax=Chlamydomonas leiostraca TaxID=1034604 RepID=A0A7S0S0S2_9CHLO|mmetsp:Transcript_35273/g.89256  ORF Transcript_35273/g.89256 Transcript_35273/m.89256 type:complete len:233 (+) Transcript_35273:183-881(+)
MIDFGPPLVVPELAFNKELHSIKLYLDQPLLSAPDVRHLVALCATADTLIERVTRLKNVESFDVSLLQEIEATCQDLYPNKKPQETLQTLGLLDMFPYLTQGLVVGKLELVTENPGAAYLNYINLMNQVVIMGTQIYHDACVTQHHKYAAHQMALLYQCLNMLQGETKPIRRVIEARFDEIKIITESKHPVFELEMSDWLQEITWLCREEIKACPPYIHRKLEQMMKVLKGS